MSIELFTVTYLNRLDGKRHVLLDNLTRDEVDAVIAKCGDKSVPEWYLPDTRVEVQS